MTLAELSKIVILNTPPLYVKDMSTSAREQMGSELSTHVATFSQKNYDLPPELLLKCSFFPDVVEALLPKLPVESPTITGLAMANIDAAFRVLTENYNTPLGEKLELTVLSHPEAVLELQEWAFAMKQTLRYSMDVYLPAIYQSLISAWKFFSRFSPVSESEFFSIMKEAHKVYGVTATHEGALISLLEDNNDSQQVRGLLSTHPRTALIGALVTEDTSILEKWLTYPQWAYHALKYLSNKLSEEQQQQCYQALVRLLPWAYQYFKEAGIYKNDKACYESHMSIATVKWQNLYVIS